MRAVIVFPFAKNPGGMDLVNATIVDELSKHGVQISIASVCKRNLHEISLRYFDISLSKKNQDL